MEEEKALGTYSTEKTMKKKLNALQAFNAMVYFLEEYYQKTANEVAEVLLSDMLFLPDGGTADPAVWKEWNNVVDRVLKEKVGTKQYLIPPR